MLLNQKIFANKTEFKFSESALRHSMHGGDALYSFSTEYSSIDLTPVQCRAKNSWFRNIGILWMVSGMVLTVDGYIASGAVDSSSWLILGVAFMMLSYLSEVKYTRLVTGSGDIRILQDKQHDAILQEITERSNRYSDRGLNG